MDWADLNDWILSNYPELHKATAYLSNMQIQIECWTIIYEKHYSAN